MATFYKSLTHLRKYEFEILCVKIKCLNYMLKTDPYFSETCYISLLNALFTH